MTRPTPTLLSVLLLALLAALRGPPGVAAQQADLVGLAMAYNEAWNDHDLETVLTFFAPDAIVRQQGVPVPAETWDAQEEATVRAYLDTAAGWPSDLAWARGSAAIRGVLTAALRANPHTDAFDYQTSGDTVTWRYRLRQEPFQRLPGVGPVEGTAEAVMRAGQITRLSVVHDPQSIARRRAAVDAAWRAWARRHASQAALGRSASGRGPPTAASPPAETPTGLLAAPSAADPPDMTLPLLFVALAAASYGLALPRRRRSKGTVKR